MFDTKEKLSELAKTLWGLNNTIGELKAGCDAIATAIDKQEERLRKVESELVSLRADIRVGAVEAREAAADKATGVASTLIASANNEVFNRLTELQGQIEAMVDITYAQDKVANTSTAELTKKKAIASPE
ncbi:MAG: hypothetical protein ACPGNV_14350 [Mangrovicoccus sp.]